MSNAPTSDVDPAIRPGAGGDLLSTMPTSEVPRCEKCNVPLPSGHSSICPKCGWYALAGVHVEIDGRMNTTEQAHAADGKMSWRAWAAIATAVAVIVESAIVRLVTEEGSAARILWSGAQFLLGVLGFLLFQAVGFVILKRRDATASKLDLLLKPFKVADLIVRDLPKRFWLFNLGVNGLVAAAAAMVIIGSVPYHVLWTGHIDYRSTQGLEDAHAPDGEATKEGQNPPRETISVLIIGFELNDDGALRSVLVAREVDGKLMYAGVVTPTGEFAQLFELRENLMSVRSRWPVIPMTFKAKWVLPKYTCQISYGFEQEDMKLTDLRWEGDVRVLRLAR